MYKCIVFTCMSVMLLVSKLQAQDAVTLTGKVLDDNGTGIPYSTIYLLNSNFSTTASSEGRFTLSKVPAGKYIIQVKALNYATLVKPIEVKSGQTEYNFSLKEQHVLLEEVIVTAQKREENAQDLPLSITSLSARKVQDYRLWNNKDLTGIVPNLYSANPGDNRNVTSIRGIATTSYDPAVATYIDGVNQFGLDTYISQLQDVERIEVLRGPQGSLYGRNAMGGVINIITKQPVNAANGFVELNFGNFNQQRYNFGMRTPLVKDKLFFGASGLYTKQDGFYTNGFNNTSFDKQNSTTGNYYLKFLASPSLSMTLNAKHVANRNQGTFPLAGSINDALSTPFMLNQNSVAGMVDNVFNTSLSINYAGSKFNFTSQSSYQANHRYYDKPLDADFSPIDGYSIVNDYGNKWNNVKVSTQEFRFSSAASSVSSLKWVAGTYLFYQHNPVKQGTHIGADGALVGAPFPNFTSITTNVSKSSGFALFGQGTYALSRRVGLVFGLRYDFEHKKQNIMGEFQPDGSAAMVTRSDTSSVADFKAFTPKAGIEYHIGATSNLYGSYSRGFRAGGISQLVGDPREALNAYKPEFSNNYEIGTKNTFADNRVRLNLALFYTTVTDAQVPTLVLPDAFTVTKNAGELSSKGAELELGLTPFKGFEADYSLGFTNAKYSRLNLSSNGSSLSLTNNRQVFTPDMTSMLALQYGAGLGSSKNVRLTLRGEWRYIGNQYFDLANQMKQDAYSLLNARAGVSVKRFELFVWGSNLSNKKYVDYAYDFGAAHLGNPRTLGLSLRTNF